MKKAIIALLLSSLLLTSLAACNTDPSENPGTGDTTESTEVTTTADTTTVATETERKDTKDNLPTDLSFNGEKVKVLLFQSTHAYEFSGEEGADIVYDALYKRNRTVEDRLKVTFESDIQGGNWGDYGTLMRTLVSSGDATYDIFSTLSNAAIQGGNDDLFLDLSQNKYIDLEQPWWWSDAIDALSVDGKTIRYLVGDICLSNFYQLGATFFNKALYEDSLGNPDALYQLVLDGNWTVDKLREYCQEVHVDENGDGVMEAGDLYGTVIGNPMMLRHLEMSSDLRRFSKDENGVKLDFDIERATAVTNILYDLVYNTPGVTYQTAYTKNTAFANREMVFYLERLNNASSKNLRNMEDDYGIIPLPKIDDNQKEYRTAIDNGSGFMVVPKTAPNPDKSGAVLEALCAESYRSVTEVFYETALKVKYSRDALSGQCIDIIQASARKDCAWDYNASFGRIGLLVEGCVSANNTDFASAYEAQRTAAEAAIAAKLASLSVTD